MTIGLPGERSTGRVRSRRSWLVLLMMMRRSDSVMSVYRIHINLIGDSVGVLAKAVVRLYRGRRLHSCQMSVRLSPLLARTVSSLRLPLAMRRRQFLILVRTTTGTRWATGSKRRWASTTAATSAAAASTAAFRTAATSASAAAATTSSVVAIAATSSPITSATHLMLKIRRVRQNFLQVVMIVMVMVVAVVLLLLLLVAIVPTDLGTGRAGAR